MSRAGSANFFCKQLDSKYFRLCRSYDFSHNYSVLPFLYTSSRRPHINKRAHVPIKFYLHTQVIKWICPMSTAFLIPDLEDKKTAPRCFRSVAKESVPVWGVSLFSYSLSDQKFCDAQEKGEIDYMVIKPAWVILHHAKEATKEILIWSPQRQRVRTWSQSPQRQSSNTCHLWDSTTRVKCLLTLTWLSQIQSYG